VPNRFREPIQAGFDAWHEHKHLNGLIRSDFGGLTPSTQWAGPTDAINNVVYINGDWGTVTGGTSDDIIALTRVRYNAVTGRITDADIAINGDHHRFSHNASPNAYDMHNIIAHEVGHVWGLSDLFPPDHPGHDEAMGDDEKNKLRTMYAVFELGETVKRTLDERDVAGIKFIYEDLPVLNVDIVLVYDGSDNYVVKHNALTQSKNSGHELVDKFRIGDRIGVVQFPRERILDLTEIKEEEDKDDVQGAISGISPYGNVTVGSGLFEALDLLNNDNMGSNLPAIILFSSGEEEEPEWAVDFIDALGGNPTVPVYTIGFEGSPGQTTLNMVSDATGGAFFEVPDSTHIPDAVGEIWTQIINQLTLFVDGGIVDFDNQPYEVLVDGDVEIFEPGIRIQGRASKLNLCIVDPDGLEICFVESDADESNEIICRFENEVIPCPPGIQGRLRLTYEYFQITNPKTGTWKLLIENNGLDDKQFFGYANATSRDFTMTAELDQKRYIIGDNINIAVNLMSGGHPTQFGHGRFGDPITGADIVVQVTLPDGAVLPDVSLQDANDGNYSASFNQTDEPGTYQFRITAMGSEGEFTRVRRLSTYVASSEEEFAIQTAFSIFDHIYHYIENMDRNNFRPAGEGRRGSLLNKLDVVHGHMQAEEYETAIQKLAQDILPKVDGDWVIGEDSMHLKTQVNRLIDALSDIIGMQTAMENRTEGNLIEQGNIPERFDILQNYPNPFNPITTIWYQLPEDLHVTLTVYNLLGQRVRTLVDGMQTAGYYSVQWDGSNQSGMTLSSGMYFYRIQAGRNSEVRKMIFMK
jgi:hypothetical protein